jgi:oligopeptide transport system substrate-binding protein
MKVFANALLSFKRAFRFSILRFPFFAFLLALLFSGCMRNEPRADIIIVNAAEPESLDPAILTGQPDGRVAEVLFEGLTRFDPKEGVPIPGLAERWDISPDGSVYTFHLRSNLTWSTGEPITADDFVYSWRRVADPGTAADYAAQLFFVKNAEAINTGKIKDLTQLGVQALDPRTLKVQLIGPTPFFLDVCALRPLVVVPRHWIEKHGDRWLKEKPMPTSGPYTLVDWRIQEKIRLRRNPRYWDVANVRNELVDFLPIESPAAALNLYVTGQADIIIDKQLIPSELMDVLRFRPDCHQFDFLGSYFFRFNLTRKPFDDPRVRRAIALCIDKSRIVERISRAGEKPASTLVPPGTANYVSPPGLGYDPQLARKLLAEAGYPDGQGFRTIEYHFNTSELHKQIAVEIREMLKRELGITMELKQTEWKVYLADQSALNFDLTRSSWIGDYNDANTFLDLFMSNNGNNRTGWKNPRYDELMRTGNAQTDKKRRAEMLAQAEKLLVIEELPIVPIYFYQGVMFYDTNKVGGIWGNVLDEHPVWTIYRKDVPQKVARR